MWTPVFLLQPCPLGVQWGDKNVEAMIPNDDSSSWNMQLYRICYISLYKYLPRVSVCSLGWFDLEGDVGSHEELGKLKWTFTVQDLVPTSWLLPSAFLHHWEWKCSWHLMFSLETPEVYIARSPYKLTAR